MNKYCTITNENLESEHICCAIGDPKHQNGVKIKKEWLQERMQEGHIFHKLDARGKVFIEYAPLETAWVPVEGNDMLYIYCLWVAGSYKGHGYGRELLTYAIEDAKKKHKKGICTITSKKKKPYLSEKKFFLENGFQVVDQIGEYELLSLNFDHIQPNFCSKAREMKIDSKVFTIYYGVQCPFTTHAIEELEIYSKEKGLNIHFEKIDSLEKAKNMPCVMQSWATFQNGVFLSNTILTKAMLEKLLHET